MLWSSVCVATAEPVKFGPVPVDELRKWEGFAAAPVAEVKPPALSAELAAQWDRRLREGLVDVLGKVSDVTRDPAAPEQFNWFAGAPHNRNVATWAVSGERGGALIILSAEGGLRVGLRLNPGVRGPANEHDFTDLTRRVLRDLWGGAPPAIPSMAKGQWLRWDGPDGFHNVPEAVVHAWFHRPNDANTPTRVSIETGVDWQTWQTLTDAGLATRGRMNKRAAMAEAVAYLDDRAGTKPGVDFGPNVPADLSGLLIHEAWANRFDWSITVSVPGWTSTLGMVDATRKLSSYGTGSSRTAAEGWRVWDNDIDARDVRKWPEYKTAADRLAEGRKRLAAAWALARPKLADALKTLRPDAVGLADSFEPLGSFFDGSRLVCGLNQNGLQRQHRVVFVFVAGVPKLQHISLVTFSSQGEPGLDDQPAWIAKARTTLEALFGEKPAGDPVVESHKTPLPPTGNRPGEQRGGPRPPFYRLRWSPTVNGLRLPDEFGVSFSVTQEGEGVVSLSCVRGIHADRAADEVKALANLRPAIDGRTAAACALKCVDRLFPDEAKAASVTAQVGLMSSDEFANIRLWSTFAADVAADPDRKLHMVWRVTIAAPGNGPSFQAFYDASTGRPWQVNRMARELPSKGG